MKFPATGIWSTAAITSDYNEKTWQIAYRGKERTYDFEGKMPTNFPWNKAADIDDPWHRIIWDNVWPPRIELPRLRRIREMPQWCNKSRKAATPKQGTPSAQKSTCTAY